MLKKHRITVTLDWASLTKDVQDKAYRMARLAKLGVQDEAAADKLESELTLTEEDMSLLKRAMTTGLGEVVTMCRDYVWNKSHSSRDYVIKEENLTMTLMMPLNFNLAGCLNLGIAIHAYIVGKAMLEWFRYTVPARAQEQMELCAQSGKEIKTILASRVRAMRSGESLEVVVGDEEETSTGTARTIYVGGSSAAEIDGAGVLALVAVTGKSSPRGSYSVALTEGQYIYLCVPSSMTVGGVTSGGFAVPMETPKTVPVDGVGDYRCYRSSEALTAGTVTITVG